ncbi:MAG: hypothetical protein DDT31_00006 [Syntrophomonadaceae bacterium]|nr:hypothetical protein [Bacillota bacterium]
MRSLDTFVEGVVVDTSDPQQMGRIKCWCSALDGENWKIETLPWATYVSPFAGQTYDYPAGPGSAAGPGPVSYGFWAIPKVGATVIIGFLYGNRNQRFYLGSYFPDHGNRSLPAGRNSSNGPQTDTFDQLEPATMSLNAQFQDNLGASEAQTRGAYERQVAQALTTKDGTEGYQKGVAELGLDPQTYCITTPGRHSLIMQDNPTNGRVRIKTANGHQVILDDANERIYVSTSKGQTWIELDQDGRIHVYAGDSISITSGGDIDISAKGSFRVSAGGNIDLGASGHARVAGCSDVSVSSAGPLNFESGGVMNLKAGGNIIQTGSNIHLNGPAAGSAPCPTPAGTTPAHEPWSRKGSKVPRNKNWKA